ncbi:MAG: ATP-binding cassette domain-containing protein [Gammaproteobacteria bacterium]
MTLSPNIIEVQDLQFRWRSHSAFTLDVPALSIRRGERVFIEGASGSGKSTLLSLLAGVVVPDEGDIAVLGRSTRSLRAAARDRFRADHIGFIFQMFNLIPYLSVLENTVLPCWFSAVRRTKALNHAASLEQEGERLLAHLDLAGAGSLDRPVAELSVGQQQRVAAARALIGGPEIVIADEPTSSLDADRRTAFLNLLFQECRAAQATLVFVSHDTSLAGLFDRTLSLAEINRARCMAEKLF